jgi:hypothetical protein
MEVGVSTITVSTPGVIVSTPAANRKVSGDWVMVIVDQRGTNGFGTGTGSWQAMADTRH